MNKEAEEWLNSITAMKFEDVICHYITEHRLLEKDRLHLVALSGGADSVALLLVLRRLGYTVEAVHCNFKLRGEESDRDEMFVKELCRRNETKLHLTHFDTRAYAETHKVGIETAARQLRYSYFEQLRNDLGADSICVAHHRDDSIETVLMNLSRGTGIDGLTGIKPRNGHIIRPLLCVDRQEIEQWLHTQGEHYVTDSTNLEPDIMRNMIRLEVMPRLCSVNKSTRSNIITTAKRLEEVAKVYHNSIEQSLSKLLIDNEISIDGLSKEPSPESILYAWLSPKGFTPQTIEAICRAMTTAQPGKRWLSDSHELTIHNGRLITSERQEERPTLRIPEEGIYVYDSLTKVKLSFCPPKPMVSDGKSACFDAQKLSFPIVIRPVKKGDRFHPFGMKGTKLVSDYLTDRHKSIFQKRSQLVLTDSHGTIAWVVGERTDDRFRIDDDTSQAIRITIF